jgi:hypothetical protein
MKKGPSMENKTANDLRLIACFAATAAIGACQSPSSVSGSSSSLVGGVPASGGVYDSVVTMVAPEAAPRKCTYTKVAEDAFLTAAHCVTLEQCPDQDCRAGRTLVPPDFQPGVMRLYSNKQAGSYSNAADFNSLTVKKVIFHPSWYFGVVAASPDKNVPTEWAVPAKVDVAIVKVNEATPQIPIAPIAQPGWDGTGPVQVVGAGRSSLDQPSPLAVYDRKVLSTVSSPSPGWGFYELTTALDPTRALGADNGWMIGGDSGGPMFRNGNVHAVFSSYNDAADDPGFGTSFYDRIDQPWVQCWLRPALGQPTPPSCVFSKLSFEQPEIASYGVFWERDPNDPQQPKAGYESYGAVEYRDGAGNPGKALVLGGCNHATDVEPLSFNSVVFQTFAVPAGGKVEFSFQARAGATGGGMIRAGVVRMIDQSETELLPWTSVTGANWRSLAMDVSAHAGKSVVLFVEMKPLAAHDGACDADEVFLDNWQVARTSVRAVLKSTQTSKGNGCSDVPLYCAPTESVTVPTNETCDPATETVMWPNGFTLSKSDDSTSVQCDATGSKSCHTGIYWSQWAYDLCAQKGTTTPNVSISRNCGAGHTSVQAIADGYHVCVATP